MAKKTVTLHVNPALIISSALSEPVGKTAPKFRVTIGLDPAKEAEKIALGQIIGAGREIAAALGVTEFENSSLVRPGECKVRGQVMTGLEKRFGFRTSSFDQPALFDKDGSEVADPDEAYKDGTIAHAIVALYGSTPDEEGVPVKVYAEIRGLKRIRFGGPLWTPPRPTASDFLESLTSSTPVVSGSGLDQLLAEI